MAYYAVRAGRRPGIYNTWEECQAQVTHFSGAVFKKFNTLQEANAFLHGSSGPASAPEMRPSGTYQASNTWAVSPTPPASWTAAPAPPAAPRTAPPAAAASGRGGSYGSGAQGSWRPMAGRAAAAPRPAATTVQPEVTRYFAGTSTLGKRKHPADEEARTVVYTDGCAFSNGAATARAGIGVYWGPNDRRYDGQISGAAVAASNVSEPVQGLATNQRAELGAALRALADTRDEATPLEIRTDSKYTINAATEWLPKWKANNFRTAANTKVKNLDLITAIDRELQERSGPVYWRRIREQRYVPGHAGVEGNEMADQLAKQGAHKVKRELL